jgi:phage replication O-like protein O
MSNLAADIVVPIRPDLRAVEKRVADTDDGYTRLANELYEELIGANLTRNQAKVAHAVCRKTYGFNKKMDRIADSQIAALTNLPRQKVNKAKNELILMKVLLKEGALIGPNKSLEDWQIPDCHQSGVVVTKPVTKNVTKTVTRVSPKQGHTKDTITKDNKDNINPPVAPLTETPVKEKKRASQFPSGFTPTDTNQLLASELGVNLQSEFMAFSDYHQSKGSTFKDWGLALNTWLRNSVKFSKSSYPAKPASAPSRAVSENFDSKNYGASQHPSWAEE